MKRLKLGSCLACACMLAGVPLVARAQLSAQQAIPAQQNPGILTPAPSEISPRPETSGKAMDEIHLDVPEPTTQETGQSPVFAINKINVEGSTLFTAAQLQAVVAPYEGREETLNELDNAVDTISRMYRERGYLTTQVYIPPQEMQDGMLTIQVREGRIGRIQIEGNKFYRPQLIARALYQNENDLLNIRTLEKDLNRGNRLNENYKMKASLSAGELPGQTDIRLQVAERQPFQISPTFDNEGRPFIGLYRGGVEFRDDSLTGWGDRFYARVLAASGTKIAMGSYTLPLNRYGTELSANYTYSRVNLDLNIKKNPPKIIGTAANYGLSLSQPLDRERHWVADVGFNWRSINSYFDGDNTQNDEIRSLATGLTFDQSDRWGRTYNRLSNSIGLGVDGATAQFWKVEDNFVRVLYLPKRNVILLRAYGQWTPDALPAAEQFQIGGEHSVRGYSEGLLTGDLGYNFSIEHHFPLPGLRLISPWLDQRIQGAWFYDVGRVVLAQNNPSYKKGSSDRLDRTLLQSVGLGVRAQLTRYLQGYVDFGFGLNDRQKFEPEFQPTARIHFGVRSDLLSENFRMRGPNFNPRPPRVSASATAPRVK